MRIQRTYPAGHVGAVHRRGSIIGRTLLAISLALVILLGLVVGVFFGTSHELQRATDATAVSVARMLTQTHSTESLTALLPHVAVTTAGQQAVGDAPLTLDPSRDFELGRIDEPSAGAADPFQAGARPSNAVRIHGRRTEGSPAGPLPVPWLSDIGLPAFNVVRTSTATVPPCDVVLLLQQPSAEDEESDVRLRGAAKGLLNAFQPMSEVFDDRVSLIAYGRAAQVASALRKGTKSALEAVDEVPSGSYEYPADLAIGIQRAHDTLMGDAARRTAAKTIIIVTIGPPWTPIAEQDERVYRRETKDGAGPIAHLKERAIQAAEAAHRDGIRIHAISVQAGVDREFLAALTRMTRGAHFHVKTDLDPSGGNLLSPALRIAATRPVRVLY